MKHRYDPEAVKTWIYPTNLPKRDYQYNIVKRCLFRNTFVALPTGLGKTFIAGVVMLNCTIHVPQRLSVGERRSMRLMVWLRRALPAPLSQPPTSRSLVSDWQNLLRRADQTSRSSAGSEPSFSLDSIGR